MAAANKTENISSNNLVIILLLITFLVIGASALVVKALISSITLDGKVAKAKGVAEKQLKDDVAAAPKLVDAYAALGLQAGVLFDALPTTGDFPSLIVLLENVSTDSGMKLKSVQPSLVGSDSADGTSSGNDQSAAPTPQPYSFVISVTGPYDSLNRFLNHLETSARPMRVTSLQLNGGGSSLSAEISLETYFQDKAQLPLGKEIVK